MFDERVDFGFAFSDSREFVPTTAAGAGESVSQKRSALAGPGVNNACTRLARLKGSSAGEFGDEAGGALGAGGGQRSEDLPGAGAF